MRKLIIILLAVICFVFVLRVEAGRLDPDLGWHLRFGKDAMEGHFQYTDSYTWTKFGEPWVNHEWGGDIFFWLIYSRFGYLPLLFIFSALPVLAFILIDRIYNKKFTIIGLAVSFFGLYSAEPVLMTRLAMFAPIFLVILLWTLKKLPEKKTYWIWIPLLWLWSILHGSWILGFIILGIYIMGEAASGKQSRLKPGALPTVIIFTALSALAVLINPYGIGVWKEVLAYFGAGVFKNYINEWLPAYTYPVYWQYLAMAGAAAAFLVAAVKKRLVSLPLALIFFAIFFSAWQYKRNMIFIALVAVPVISAGLQAAAKKIAAILPRLTGLSEHWNKKIGIGLTVYAVLALGMLLSGQIVGLTIPGDIWQKNNWAEQTFPTGAVNFLRQQLKERPAYLYHGYIFNEFWWGGYINYTLPEALVFLDGRGTATWLAPNGKTMLEYYRAVKFDEGGLQTLENSPADYVLIEKIYSDYAPPDFVNRLIFSKAQFKKILDDSPSRLELDLRKSKKWKLLFSDGIALLWERIK